MAHMWTEAQWPQLQRLIALTDVGSRMLGRGEITGPVLTGLRQLEDALGISEKGRRSLRWRLPAEEDPDAPVATVTKLPSRQQPDPRDSAS